MRKELTSLCVVRCVPFGRGRARISAPRGRNTMKTGILAEFERCAQSHRAALRASLSALAPIAAEMHRRERPRGPRWVHPVCGLRAQPTALGTAAQTSGGTSGGCANPSPEHVEGGARAAGGRGGAQSRARAELQPPRHAHHIVSWKAFPPPRGGARRPWTVHAVSHSVLRKFGGQRARTTGRDSK